MNIQLSDLTKKELISKCNEQSDQLKKYKSKISNLKTENDIFFNLFDNSPIPLWQEDITRLINYIQKLKSTGVDNFDKYFQEHPHELDNCISKIKFVNINKAAVKLHKAKSKEQIFSNINKIFTQNSKLSFQKEISAIANGDRNYESEITAKTFNNELLYLKFNLQVIERKENSKVKYIAHISTVDISKQKVTKDNLKNSEITLRNILDASDDLAILTDTKGFIIETNKACQNFFASSRCELLGRQIKYLSPENLAIERKNKFEDAILKRESVIYEDEMYGKHWLNKYFPIIDENDKIEKVVIFHRDITNKYLAEKAIAISELKYKSIFNNIKSSIVHIDKNGFITDINEYHLKDISNNKRSIEEFVGTNILERNSIQKAGIINSYKELLKGKEFKLSNVYFPETTGGHEYYFNIQGIPIFENKQFKGAIVVTEDVTQKIIDKKRLKESEFRLSLALEGASVGYWDHDYISNKVWRSNQWFEMLGYKKEDFLDDFSTWKQLIHPDDLEFTISEVEKHRSMEIPELKVEHRLKNSEGNYQWIINWGKIIERSEDGKPIRAAGLHIDNTERKKAELALKESEQKYSTLIEQANEGIIVVQDWEIKFCNRYFEEMLGYSKEELLNKQINKLLPDEILDITKQNYESRLRGEIISNIYEASMISKSGKKIPIEINAQFMRFNLMPAVQIIIRDISDRKKVEQEKLERQKELSLIYNSSSDNMALAAVKENEFILISFNDSFWNSMCKFNPKLIREDFLNQSLNNLDSLLDVPSSFSNYVIENCKSAFDTKSTIDIIENIPIEDSEIILESKYTPIIDSSNNCTHILFVSQDITERRNAELAIQRSEEKFRSLFENMEEGVFYQNADGDKFDVNDSALRIFDLKRDEFLGESHFDPFWRIIDKNKNEIVFEDQPPMIALKTGKEVLGIELGIENLITKKIKWLIVNAIPQFRYGDAKAFQVFVTMHDISERKIVETNLQQTKEQLEVAIAGSEIGIFTWDLVTGEIEVSNKVVKSLGYEIEEMGSINLQTIEKLAHPEDLKKAMKHLQAHFEQLLENHEAEMRIKSKTGSWIWFLIRGKVVNWGQDGKPLFMTGTHLDITERKLNESIIQKTKEQLQFAIYGSGVGIWDWNIATDRTYLSERWASMLGYTIEELQPTTSLTWEKLLHPEDREKTTLHLKNFLENKEDEYNPEFRLKNKSGKWIWILARGKVVEWDDNGNPLRMVGTHQDITQRKIAETELTHSENRYQALFDYSPVPLWEEDFTDLHKYLENLKDKGIEDIRKYFEDNPSEVLLCSQKVKILDVNEATLRLHKAKSKEELLGNLDKIFTPNSLNIFKEEVIAISKGISEYETEGEVKTLDGIPKHVYLKLITSKKLPSFRGLIATLDISQRKKIEEELEKQKAIYKTVSELISDFAYAYRVEDDGKIVSEWVTGALKNITGYNKNELADAGGWEALVYEPDMKIPEKQFKTLLSGKAEVVEYRIVTKKGAVRWIRDYAQPVIDQVSSRTSYIYGAIQDITEKANFEMKLQESNDNLRNLSRYLNNIREEERKNIAREVHDNLGQKLTALNLDISWIKQSLPENLAEVRDKFEPVLDLINQSIVTVQKISTELRPGILDDLGLINAIQWQSNEIHRRTDLTFSLNLYNKELDLSDDIKTALFRVYQEALTNIVRHSEAKIVDVNLLLKRKNLIFEIIDDGIGIPEDKLEDFKSFGLIGMKERIISIGGEIIFSNLSNKGTKITISVPI